MKPRRTSLPPSQRQLARLKLRSGGRIDRTRQLHRPEHSPEPPDSDLTGAERGSLDLRDFFSAAEAREDRWQQLNDVAQAWRQSGTHDPSVGTSNEQMREQALAILRELGPLETFWAFPGPAAMDRIGQALTRGDVDTLAHLTARISRNLLGGAYRHDPNCWNLDAESNGEAVQRGPSYFGSESHRP
jgi:hypothetical protein